ncbi:bifunctional 2-polyprenyl-6-hydroxyphenol methylase/3-demethylubiquinol 3-O-methyltransferase UbiG [Marichromatium sp. AB31]|uniref:class I SAM-dependent methyltransferase n=1 Tax=Marichromatium sp. AB31 TaxID=2483362 RepID=UPI000F3CE614|nr:class I SAM-dependent methyltransferase [Marichromatium sp. AB31]RNE89723.1 class I SAM-dependent methyltransferase [Marichromatium sp. AB31]
MTLDYYNTHASAFFAATHDVDMEPLYARFLAHVPPGGRLLDAGCGSGRDTRAFLERGYTVTAFDASPTLATLATAHCGIDVEIRRFQEIEWSATFDGIWACASLLHVSLTELPAALYRLARSLKPAGVLYASFKYGTGEHEHNGRRFTDLDEDRLATLVSETEELETVEVWTTADRRPGRESEYWLNALLRHP